ncbi:sporulation protein YjcZ [Paenibacillus athensensis]|nr:sporulation protein YjcZ [Paenibacillus athensensis]MCD1259445.1 sporulation protein YjcZ [Paenibacillus athensensis]
MSCGCEVKGPYTNTAVILVLYILLVIVLSTFGFGL